VDFKVDENLPEEVAAALREAGHDAMTVQAQGLAGQPDDRIAVVVSHERRALLTLDTDFADIRTYPPAQYDGLVVLRLARQDKEHVLAVTRNLIPSFAKEPLKQRLWIVDEDSIRIRGGDAE